MQEYKPVKEGKAREIYDNGDSLIMVAADRISVFDVILKNEIMKKDTVLTQMSKFWLDFTKDIVPNHMLSMDVNDMPGFFRQLRFDGNSMMCRKLTMLPIECIVRGYITGSGWASYQKTGLICGIWLLLCALFGLIVTSLIGNITALSRLLYALAEDEILPRAIARVSRRGIPVNAVLLLWPSSCPFPSWGGQASAGL